jgi:threonine/homoserine/homoserine lactone efflux protein
MQSAIIVLVLVTAITPGPNNLIVLRAATRSGVMSAVPSILGIVLGSLGLLALVFAGAGAAFEAEPRLRAAVTIGGCVYLCWLGVNVIRGSASAPSMEPGSDAVRGMASMFLFQFLNPKGWVMVLTASSVAGARFWQLAIVFAVIPTVCLGIWAVLGAGMSRALRRPMVTAWFDRAMGILLVVSAAAIAMAV